MATFSQQIDIPRPRTEVLGSLLESLNKPLRGLGYKIESQTVESVVWRRSLIGAMFRRPWGVLWLPLGLIGGVNRVTVSLADNGSGGTIMTVAGSGPRRLARAFRKLAGG